MFQRLEFGERGETVSDGITSWDWGKRGKGITCYNILGAGEGTETALCFALHCFCYALPCFALLYIAMICSAE